MKIFVACSAEEGLNVKYYELAATVGQLIAQSGNELIFGASNKGMMGKVYENVKFLGGKITAVCPYYWEEDLKHIYPDETIMVNNPSDQITYLTTHADAIIVLPGGYGAMAELTMAIHTKRAQEHHSPIIVVNAFGYYNSFHHQYYKGINEGFIKKEKEELFEFVDTAEEAMQQLVLKRQTM